MVIFLDPHTHLFYFTTRCNIDFPPTVLPDISKSRSKTWRYRGIHLHCSLLYLHEGVTACTVVTTHSPRTRTESGVGVGTGTGAVIGSSCIPNPLTPIIPKAERLLNQEKELKMWRLVVVVDIQQPHYIRIRSDDPSCEVRTSHISNDNSNSNCN